MMDYKKLDTQTFNNLISNASGIRECAFYDDNFAWFDLESSISFDSPSIYYLHFKGDVVTKFLVTDINGDMFEIERKDIFGNWDVSIYRSFIKNFSFYRDETDFKTIFSLTVL